jgi:hypothetical protein
MDIIHLEVENYLILKVHNNNMFGFGKKSKDSKDIKNKQQTVEIAAISDDKFVVMPQEYLDKGPRNIKSSTTKGINKKFLILGGGALLVLIIISVVLYFVLFTQETISTPSNVTTQQESLLQNNTQILDETPTTPEITEKIVSGQAFGATNTLIGTLNLTVPATVVQTYGSGIGITILSEEDITLPETGTILGGLYSVYPVGTTFEEPLSLEISVSSIPEEYNKSDIYPAYLRGVRWQEFEDYQVSLSGFTFTLEKFPTGPIAVIWNPEENIENSDELSFAQVIPSIDTDSDGLTDAEEQLLGTSLSSVDTDEDTYSDLEELHNGYSPLLGDGATLESAGMFGTYTNSTYGYQASYPVSWLADSLDQSNKQVLFISNTEEFFEILIIENPLNTPIVDWFRGQSPSLANIDLDITVIDNNPAVWSPDGLTMYTSKDGLIYILTYNTGTRDEMSWPNLFEYFYSSFRFGNTTGDGGIVDCGTSGLVNVNITSEPYVYTAEEETKQVMSCFTEYIQTCDPAFISVPDAVDQEKIWTYNINEKSNTHCEILGPIYDTQDFIIKEGSCSFPVDYIDFVFNSVERDHPGELYLKGNSILNAHSFGPTSIEYPPGDTWQVDCTIL